MYRQIRAFLLWFPLLLISGATLAASEALTFGIVPQQAPSKLASLWGPLLNEVSRKSGIQLQFATAPSIPEFEQRLANGEYDIAYMNPYHFTVFNRSPGYLALAKAKDKHIKGIMVVRKDSPVTDLSELAGKQIAFPAPAAFAATLLSQSHLNNAHIDYQPKYVSSHDSVYLTVAKGLYAAGGGIVRTLNNTDPEVRESLRIIWTSSGYTPHAIASHPRVPAETRERLREALLALADDANGQALLNGLRIKGWETAQGRDWDDVRQLNIGDIDL